MPQSLRSSRLLSLDNCAMAVGGCSFQGQHMQPCNFVQTVVHERRLDKKVHLCLKLRYHASPDPLPSLPSAEETQEAIENLSPFP
jgi:hypothetical protein